MHAHKSLSNETIITQDCRIRNKVGVHGNREGVCHPLLLFTQCLNRAWLMILQPIHLLRKLDNYLCEDRLVGIADQQKQGNKAKILA